MKIAILIVNFNSHRECNNLLNDITSCSSFNHININIYIIDNSENFSFDKNMYSSQSINIKFYHFPENLGYFGGVNKLLGLLDKKNYDFIIIANPDIRILDKDFFKKVSKFEITERVGVIGTQLYSSLSGKNENPFLAERPTKLRMWLYSIIFSVIVLSWFYHLFAVVKYKLNKLLYAGLKNKQEEVTSVYAVHGCFFILTKYFFLNNDLHYKSFLYGEEIFLAEKCISLGLKTLYNPNLSVLHLERQSTGLIYSKKILEWKKTSAKYLYISYFKKKS